MKSSKIIATIFLNGLLIFAMLDKTFADIGDVDREIQRQEWEEKENKLPDDKRWRVSGFGRSILVEKATKLTLGVYPIENGKIVNVYPKPTKQHMRSRQLQIVFNGTTYAYDIGGADTCPESNSEIIQSTRNYIFWIDRCFSKNRRGEPNNTFTHYIFDKEQKKVVQLISSSYPMNKPNLKYQGLVYKYRWAGRNGDDEKVSFFYEFEIKPKDGADLTCHKTWNDSCGDLNIIPLIYKK